MHASFTIGPYLFHLIACCVWGGLVDLAGQAVTESVGRLTAGM
jgi:hypothetical protein